MILIVALKSPSSVSAQVYLDHAVVIGLADVGAVRLMHGHAAPAG